MVPVPSEDLAIAITGALRAAAIETWRSGDPLGIDIAAIEHIDARSIAVIREDGVDRKLNVSLPSGSAVALLTSISSCRTPPTAPGWSSSNRSAKAAAADSPLARFGRILQRLGVFDDTEIALPGNRSRAAEFAELREAVPSGVNRRVAQARLVDAAISKTAARLIVPFDRFGDMLRECRRLFAERDLDLAVWGHISDGNVHPNVIPRRGEDVIKGREAILELWRMGDCTGRLSAG